MMNHTSKHDGGTFLWNAAVRRLCLAVALALVMAVVALDAPPAGAQTATTFVSNLTTGTDQNLDILGAGGDPIAQGFTTGPNTGSNTGGFTLTGVDIESRETSTTKTFAASVCSVDASGNPTDSCTALTAPSSFTTGVLSFTAPANTTLDASTAYLFVMTPSYSGSFAFVGTRSDDEDSGAAAGWSIANIYRFATGTSWGPSTAQEVFRIAIKGFEGVATNNAPTVANEIPNQSATVGTAFSYAFPANTFSDADSDTLTYTATKSDDSALPSWLTFTASTRTFSGTPQTGDVGTLLVKVKADDSNGGTVTDTFNINVMAQTAQVLLVSNASEDPTASLESVAADELVAVSFTTGANRSGYRLSSVGLGVIIADSAVPAVAIYDDSSGSPGTSQDTLTNPASFPTATGEDLFSASDVELAANTKYWVVVDKGTAGTLSLIRTASDEQTGETEAWGIGNAYRTKTGTGSWTADSSGRTLHLSVRGTKINVAPEFPAETAARSVAENTYRGDLGGDIVDRNTFSGNVGAAVAATDADRDALTYSLAATSDSDAAAHLRAFNQDFALDAKTGQVSIRVGALIDYEDRTSYKVKLQVSDGKDSIDRADATIDDTTTLTITVTDVANERPHTTRAPQVGSAGTDCVWNPGEKVVITLNFNEAVTVVTTGGTPSLTFEWHFKHAKSAEYESGSGTRDLKFAYTVPAGDPTYKTMRVMRDTLVLNGGTITGAGGVAADLRMGPGGLGFYPKSGRCAPWPDTSKPNPTISSVGVGGASTHGAGAGTWSVGRTGVGARNVDVWLTFSEPVTVFTGGYEVYGLPPDIRRTIPPPTVKIKTEFGDKTATWVFTAVSNSLTFRYTPTSEDGFIREVEVVGNSLTLNGTRIRSVASGQTAVITHDGKGSVTQLMLLVGNQTETRAALVSNSDEENAGEWVQKFTTGSEAVTLDGVRIRGTFTNKVSVDIFNTKSDGTPDAILYRLQTPGGFTNLPRSGNFYFRYVGGAALALEANTIYWVSIGEIEAGGSSSRRDNSHRRDRHNGLVHREFLPLRSSRRSIRD